MNYADRLELAIARTQNPCLVGLDPHPDSLPEEFSAARNENASRSERARAMGDFCCAIVDLVAGQVAAVKPQSAFFELYGADGAREWERVVAHAKQAGLLVIGDVKRGDIDSTAQAYARGLLAGLDARDRTHTCDAITINPYLGGDSIRPFIETAKQTGAGLYVLVRTSNKDSKLFQEHGTPLLYQKVADQVALWGSELMGSCGMSSLGAVVGATHPKELTELRARMPKTPLLLPGYGAQGAGAADIVGGFLRDTSSAFGAARGAPRGALVNSSRGILFAYKQPQYAGLHWKDASRQALSAMIAEIRAALQSA